MKKYIILILLLIPIKINAQVYYTDYKPYLSNVKEKIELNDLIKEEVITTYYYTEEIKTNSGYYPCEQSYVNRPYKDLNNKILVKRHEVLNRNPGYTRTKINVTEDFLVKEFKFSSINFIPELYLYNNDLKEIKYEIIDNKIVLKEEISILDLIIYFDATNVARTGIDFDNEHQFHTGSIIHNIPYYEMSFIKEEDMNKKLQQIGVYTSANYGEFGYYVKYSYNCLHYDLSNVTKMSTEYQDNYFKKEETYNYYKRDIIEVKDYLLNNEDNLSNIIISTTLDLDTINIKTNGDLTKNGVYELIISYEDLIIKKPIIILKEVKKEISKCEPIIQYKEVPKYIEKEVIKYIEKPIYLEKEIIKYKTKPKYIMETKYIEKPCVFKENNNISKDKTITKNTNKMSSIYLLPIIPLILIIIKKLRRNIFKNM